MFEPPLHVFGGGNGVIDMALLSVIRRFDEWQDAMAFEARQAVQERKRLGLAAEAPDPNDPMRRR